MMFFKLVKDDIRHGVLERYPIFLLTFVSTVVLSYVAVRTMIDVRHIQGVFTTGDGLCYIFRGMEEYIPSQDNDGFDVSEYYLVWLALFAFAIGHYPVKDIKGMGKLVIIQSGSKLKWWLSKCVWSIFTSVTYTLCMVLGIVTGMILLQLRYDNVKAFRLTINRSMFENIFLGVPNKLDESLVYKLLLLIFLGYIAIGILQLAFMIIGNSLIGYMSVIVGAVLSAYYMNNYMIGNAFMVYRYIEINARGVSLLPMVITCVVITLISVVAGYVVFGRKDII